MLVEPSQQWKKVKACQGLRKIRPKSLWGPGNRGQAEIVQYRDAKYPLSFMITCANQGCSEIATVDVKGDQKSW